MFYTTVQQVTSPDVAYPWYKEAHISWQPCWWTFVAMKSLEISWQKVDLFSGGEHWYDGRFHFGVTDDYIFILQSGVHL